MQLTSGRVVGGRVELDGELPEGATVVVLAVGDEGTFEADPATEQMLLESIAQCERGQTVSADTLLAELRERR
jgi:hypothetical protein